MIIFMVIVLYYLQQDYQSAISSAVLSQCIANTSVTLTNPPVPFATQYLGSWINTPATVADAITNLWITVCDIYNYLIALTFTGDTTSTIALTVSSGPAHIISDKNIRYWMGRFRRFWFLYWC